MKNVQVIDSSTHCRYPVYALTDEEFTKIFPTSSQDIEFLEDVQDRLPPNLVQQLVKNFLNRCVKKPEILGIHGTLFCDLSYKKAYYPTKSEQDVAGPPHSPLASMVGFKDKDGSMKNVQVIDGASNCTYPVYAFTPEEFATLFPAPGQDVEFIEDIQHRLAPDVREKTFQHVWSRRVEKPDIAGIHGTLFYELLSKKQFYLNKSEKDAAPPP